MSARIRGHYRIDSQGRIEPLLDVNASAMQLRSPPPPPVDQLQARLVRLSILGFVAVCLGIGSMLAMPKIQQSIVSAQSARYAMVRHMHGHHRHEMAERLFRSESVN